MPRPLKLAAILVGIVVGIIVLLAIGVALMVDPNRYRDDIMRMVTQQTGRDFKIEGDLKLSLFPWLGLETGRLTLANAAGFGQEPFARVESAGVQVQLLPLLRKEIVVEAVHLKGLNLNLARNAQGKTNWQDLGPAQPTAKPEPAPKQPGAAGAAALAVNKLEVRNANVTWDDRQSGARYAVRGLDLTSGNLLGDAPVPVKLSFDFESGQPKLKNRVELNARAHVDLAKDALNVPELKLNAGPLALNASVVGTGLQTNPKFAGKIDIARFNARDLMRQFGVDYRPADPKALTGVGLSTRYAATTQSLALTDLAFTLDDTRLTGSASAASFAPLVPRFDLAIDRLDLDRYLPAAAKGDGGKTAEQDKPAAAAAVIPLVLLRELDTQGELKIQTLKAFNLQSQEVSVQVTARNGNITLGPNTAKLYGGSYSGRTVIDASAKVPRFQFTEKLANVQLGPFLKDAEVFDRYSGTGNVELNLTGQGLDGPAITRSLNGTAAVALRDGKVRGVNLQKLVNDARAAYDMARGCDAQGNPQASDETAFQSLTANIKVTNGVARNDDLKLVGPVVRATGQGSADLAQETIDYRLRVTVSEAADRQGTTLPTVHISGPFANPKYSVDLGEILREKAGEALERKGESLQKKLEEKLKRKLQR